ncbi:MAG TPA: YXWGXW repeat-containing protein [Steroidobacteraceae bacterium]|nr:YXWGXW repeat-containing protein [Steroidobacteraceae bacterium]
MTRPVSVRVIPLAATALFLAACAAQVRVAPAVYVPPDAVVQVRLAPPPLPVYVQPPCPVAGWIWTPGYWAWAPAGYYWVPGTWVAPPRIGVLWTPGYWGYIGGAYVWHAGYWGPHVGFYGGVHYGFGYTGVGYAGGRWVGGTFAYNRSVTNVNVTVVHNIYNETVVNDVNVTRVSYNGGAGIRAEPTAQERLAEREQHVQATAMQRQHVERARNDPAMMAHANHGHPAIAAIPRTGRFDGRGSVGDHGAGERANGRSAEFRGNMNRGNAAHAARDARRPEARHPGPRKHRNAKRRQNRHGQPD